MSIGVLIVGLGRIGMGYDLHLDSTMHVCSHSRAFSQHPGFHLVGGVDPEEQRRKIFQGVYKCPAHGDVDDALRQHRPDLAVIAVPTMRHEETLRQVLGQAQPTAILCEKPLSYSTDEAETMVQTCAARGVSLYVNYMRRSDPGAIEVKRRLDAGEIAGPIKGIAWYSKGFLHNGSHLFNLLEYWLGPMSGFQVLDAGRLLDGVDAEPDVRVEFEKGTIVFLASREEAFSHYTVELVAANGRLRYEHGGEQMFWQTATADPHFPGYSVLSSQLETIPSGMDRYQWHVAHQLDAALAGREFQLCTGIEALATLMTMQSIIDAR